MVKEQRYAVLQIQIKYLLKQRQQVESFSARNSIAAILKDDNIACTFLKKV